MRKYVVLLLGIILSTLVCVESYANPNPPRSIRVMPEGLGKVLVTWSCDNGGGVPEAYEISSFIGYNQWNPQYMATVQYVPGQCDYTYHATFSTNTNRILDTVTFIVRAKIGSSYSYDSISYAENIVEYKYAGFIAAPFKLATQNVQYTGYPYFYRSQSLPSDVNYTFSLQKDSLGNNPFGIQIDASTGIISWLPKQTGFYPFVMMATPSRDPSLYGVTPIQCSITVNPAKTDSTGDSTSRAIRFTSCPSSSIYRGQTFRYQAQAMTSSNNQSAILNFTLTTAPSGMGISSVNSQGQHYANIEWTPPGAGDYPVTIRCTQKNTSTFATQSFVIHVASEYQPCNLIVGRLRDQNNKQLMSNSFGDTLGHVYAWRTDNDSIGTGVYTGSIGYDGGFFVSVPQGHYLLNFVPNYTAGTLTFDQEWWKDATSAATATPISFTCQDSIVMEPVVNSHIPVADLKYTGTVKDDQGNGIPNVTVIFYMFADQAGTGSPVYDVRTTTDANGQYNIMLFSNKTYAAYALPRSNNWYPAYYPNTDNLASATRIQAPALQNAVNFSLYTRQQSQYQMAVDVRGPNNEIVFAHVEAFYVGNANVSPQQAHVVGTVDSSVVDLLGMANGDYVILVTPSSRSYVAGYYVANGTAVTSWTNATRVNPSQITFVMARLALRQGTSGFGGADGTISGSGGIIHKSGSGIQSVKPIEGALVYAVSKQGVVDFTTTSADGKYVLSALPIGDLSLVIDKVGYQPVTTPIEISADSKYHSAKSVELQAAATSDVTDEHQDAVAIRPMPVDAQLKLTWLASNPSTQISIHGVDGVELSRREINSVIGMNTTSISTTDLGSGTYYLQIQSGTAMQIVSFVIVR